MMEWRRASCWVLDAGWRRGGAVRTSVTLLAQDIGNTSYHIVKGYLYVFFCFSNVLDTLAGSSLSEPCGRPRSVAKRPAAGLSRSLFPLPVLSARVKSNVRSSNCPNNKRPNQRLDCALWTGSTPTDQPASAPERNTCCFCKLM